MLEKIISILDKSLKVTDKILGIYTSKPFICIFIVLVGICFVSIVINFITNRVINPIDFVPIAFGLIVLLISIRERKKREKRKNQQL